MARAAATTARKPVTDEDRNAAVERAKAKNAPKPKGVPDAPRLELKIVPLEQLIPSEDNLRGPISLETDDELADLSDSIGQIGIRQALSVEPHPFEDGSYRIKAGHRRHAAAALAGLTAVPCVIEPLDEESRWDSFLAENIHRKGLTPMQVARGLQHFADLKMGQREIATRAGMSQPHVSKLLSLNKLPKRAQEWVDRGLITQDTAVELARLPKGAIEVLCEDGPPSDSDLRSYLQEYERENRRDAAHKAATDAGLTILESAPAEWIPVVTIDGETPAAILNGTWGTLGHVDPDEHASEPCHAVWIDHQGRTLPVCTNHEAHPKPEGDDAPPRTPLPRSAALEAQDEAEAALLPSYRNALSLKVDPSLVVSFSARALLREEEPWEAAEKACQFLALDERAEDPLEDLARLADDGDPGTALLAFAIASGHAHLQALIRDVTEGTPIEVVAEHEPASYAAAGNLLDFIRLVCPNDEIEELATIVADFAEVEEDDDEASETVQPEEAPEQEEDSAVESAGDDEAETSHFDLDALEEGPTETGADAPTPSSTDAEDAPAGAGDADVPVITIVKGGRSGAPKYFRDCSACAPTRLGGFNTNEKDARERALKHFEEDHAGAGVIGEAGE